MLTPGDPAPDFTLPDQHGDPVKLSGLQGKTVVLYFYPKADTPDSKNSMPCGPGDISSLGPEFARERASRVARQR